MILESPTWRANTDWATKLGYSREQLHEVNTFSIELMHRFRIQHGIKDTVVSGAIGPRADGYIIDVKMTEEEAEEYHGVQIQTFSAAKADMVTIMTINYVEEAIGAVRAAIKHKIPIVVSFTTEIDGKLPSG